MVQFVLKTCFQGDLRRRTFDSVGEVSYQTIRDFVASSYELRDFQVKYQDEEGDWCTLTAATLTDAMDLVKDKQLLRLEVQPVGAAPLPVTLDDATSRSPSECSWEMLDLEDEDMDNVEESSVVPPVEESHPGALASVASTRSVQGSETNVSVAESEDGFLLHEVEAAPSATTEGSVWYPGWGLLEPAHSEAAAEPAEAVDVEEATIEPTEAVDEATVEPTEAVDEATVEPTEAVDEEMRASAPELVEEPAATELTHEEKINLILAAFDKNGDGRLNFEECIDLLMWASGELMPWEVFQMTCDELRVNSQQGFGPLELTTLWDCFGTQERDFQAALRKLAHEPAAPAPAAGAAAPDPSDPSGPSGVPRHFSPWMALPLLPICPVAAGAVALAATLRNRTCQ